VAEVVRNENGETKTAKRKRRNENGEPKTANRKRRTETANRNCEPKLRTETANGKRRTETARVTLVASGITSPFRGRRAFFRRPWCFRGFVSLFPSRRFGSPFWFAFLVRLLVRPSGSLFVVLSLFRSRHPPAPLATRSRSQSIA
jgi:hypothetical protein